MRWLALLVALGVIGLGWVETPEAQEREKTTVAVEHFEAGAGLEEVAAQVSDALIARLVAHFTLLTRKDMDAVLAEHRLGFSDGMRNVAEFGEMLGARKIILGRVDSVASSEAVRICLRMVDVERASLDFQEVAELVPRERVSEATELLSNLIIAKVPLRGRIVQVQKDLVRINLGSADKLREDATLEVLKESEYGWITVGQLSVVSVDAYSSKASIARQEEPFEEGQFVETAVNERQVNTLRKRLIEVGRKERHRLDRIAGQKKKLDEERLRTEQTEQERLERMAQERHKLEQMRMRVERAEEERKLPIARLRLGVGYFEPADSTFKDTYYQEGTDLGLGDPSFYSVTAFFLSHPYFRGYSKATYFNRKKPEPEDSWEEQEERTIFRSVLGARVQFPIEVPPMSIVPYVGGGGAYASMRDSENDESLNGMGYEFFYGATLVVRRAIGVFMERNKEIISVGKDEDEEDIGGTSVRIGVEIWW